MACGAEPTWSWSPVESEVEGVGAPLKGRETLVSGAEDMMRLWEGTRADTKLENIIHHRLYSQLSVTYIHARRQARLLQQNPLYGREHELRAL